jgi:uncharacterized membrane protein YjjP (DUF1212 family)
MAAITVDVLSLLQSVIVILGLIIIYYATRGYRKTNNKSLLFLAFGFLFVTIGAVAAGLLFQFLNFDIYEVEAIQAGSEVIGFLLIVYSIIGIKS